MSRGRSFAAGVIGVVVLTAVAGCADSSHARAGGGSSTAPVARARGLTIRVHLDETTVPAGEPITGTVTVDNETGHPIPTSCERWVQVGLANAQIDYEATWLAPLCFGPPIPTGESHQSITVATRYNYCAPSPTSVPAKPRCLPGDMMPPLPAGTYHTVVAAALSTITVPTPPPVEVQIESVNSGLPWSSPGPIAPPCPKHLAEPSVATGTFCGPAPSRGSGHDPDGICDGSETTPPCGAGAVVNRYYSFTVPGNCSIVRFNGTYWRSTLNPPHAVANMYVWMALNAHGGAGWISPNGAVGFAHVAGTPPACPNI
jgi:hypothetical protein